MKTLIFIPSDDEVNGYMELTERENGIKIKYGFTLAEQEEGVIYKLYGLSAKKPFGTPVVIDTIEFKDNLAQSERELTLASLGERGYLPEEINTFVLVKKNFTTADVKVAAKCFAGLVWEVDGAFENTGEVKVISPLRRGTEALEKIKKRTQTTDANVHKIWLKRIENAVRDFEKFNTDISGKYEWYRINSMIPPVNLPAYRHLLFVTEVMESVYKNGFYLFGNGKYGHTALAVIAKSVNPFINADDCSKKINDFYTVGVLLAPDGQYFEKIEI